MIAVKDFSFDSPGELYCQRQSGRKGMMYRRFTTAAAAIRYAMEVLEPGDLLGCTLEVEGERYGAKELKELYASSDYPLKQARP